MLFEEWFKENGYDKIEAEITLTHERVEGYPGFYKDKLNAAFEAGKSQVVNECEDKLKEKDVIINFLKKELIHKTAYKNVMKRQYRELKQKIDADKERYDNICTQLADKCKLNFADRQKYIVKLGNKFLGVTSYIGCLAGAEVVQHGDYEVVDELQKAVPLSRKEAENCVEFYYTHQELYGGGNVLIISYTEIN